MDDRKVFPGQRITWLYRQTPGVRNAIYPWVIQQGNNGATVKMDDDQMKGVVNAVLNAWGYDLIP